jgi:hypothetical protein
MPSAPRVKSGRLISERERPASLTNQLPLANPSEWFKVAAVIIRSAYDQRWIAMRRTGLIVLTAALLAAACAATFDFRREELFEDMSKRYGRLIRWSEFDPARPYLAADAPPERTAVPASVRVADYEVKQVAYADDMRQAIQTVRITYFKQDNPRLRTLDDLQVWEFSADKGAWFLKSGFPDFQ